MLEVNGLIFKGEFPTPAVMARIDADVSNHFRGVPVESIPPSSYNYISALVTLNHVIDTLPEKWRKKPEDMDWVSTRDPNLPMDVWAKYQEQLSGLNGELKKNGEPKGDAEPGDVQQPALPLSGQERPARASRTE